MALPDNSRLVEVLNASRIATQNNALYQVIKALIDNLQQTQREFTALIGGGSSSGGGGGGGGGGLANHTYVTVVNELATLPNSRRLVAGAGIVLDTSLGGQIIVETSSGGDYVVMSDGANPAQPMNDGNGNFIYIPYVP